MEEWKNVSTLDEDFFGVIHLRRTLRPLGVRLCWRQAIRKEAVFK